MFARQIEIRIEPDIFIYLPGRQTSVKFKHDFLFIKIDIKVEGVAKIYHSQIFVSNKKIGNILSFYK